MGKLKKLYEKIKPYIGILAIIYPYIQIAAAAKGIDLPDLGSLGNTISQGLGTVALAQSDKVVKRKPKAL